MRVRSTVIVVGGGASSALLGIHLVAKGIQTTVIDPSPDLGTGIAYSTQCPFHLLNIPAADMSAFADEPDHFLDWLWRRGYGQYDGDSFVPRSVYGRYIQSLVRSAQSAEPGTLTHLERTAFAADVDSEYVSVKLDNGSTLTGDALVLATGDEPPRDITQINSELTPSRCYFGSCWDKGALKISDVDTPILLLGSGLTAIDAALALRFDGHRGKIVMLSRHGLLPLDHTEASSAGAGFVLPMPGQRPAELLKSLRLSAAVPGGWRSAIDEVRAQANSIWRGLSESEQRRFLRHLRAYWDAHCQRMAPEVSKKIRWWLDEGSLEVYAGRIHDIQYLDGQATVRFTRRGESAEQTHRFGRIINCTGAERDLDRTTNPLLNDLAKKALIRRNAHGLGIMTDENGAVINASQSTIQRLFAIGSLRFGDLLETIAIPEIRNQAESLASYLEMTVNVRDVAVA